MFASGDTEILAGYALVSTRARSLTGHSNKMPSSEKS